jgi:hypothetical protein
MHALIEVTQNSRTTDKRIMSESYFFRSAMHNAPRHTALNADTEWTLGFIGVV